MSQCEETDRVARVFNTCPDCGVLWKSQRPAAPRAPCPDCAHLRAQQREAQREAQRPRPIRHNPYARVFHANSKALRRGIEGSLTPEQWLRACIAFDGRCAYCDTPISYDQATVEHFIPVSAGGSTSMRNCIPTCAACNDRKRDTHPIAMPQRLIWIGNARLQKVYDYLTAQGAQLGPSPFQVASPRRAT